MSKEIEMLSARCENEDFSRAEYKDFSDEYGTTKVYKVDGGDLTLYYWNSQNSRRIEHSEALNYISEELMNGVQSGTVFDGWNEIMFEIK